MEGCLSAYLEAQNTVAYPISFFRNIHFCISPPQCCGYSSFGTIARALLGTEAASFEKTAELIATVPGFEEA